MELRREVDTGGFSPSTCKGEKLPFIISFLVPPSFHYHVQPLKTPLKQLYVDFHI